MNLSDSAAARQIMSALTATGATPPKAVVEAYAATTELDRRALGSIAPGDLATAVAAAFTAGRDPAADPEVQRIVTARALANEGVAAGLDALVFERFREVCREHADAIVHAWRVPFDRAAEVLADAHDRLGDVDLSDAHEVLNRGGDAAEVWATAHTAQRTVDTIMTGWTFLAMFTRLVSVHKAQHALRFTELDVTAAHLGASLTPWDAIVRGLMLSLPTMSEYRQRVQTLSAALNEQQYVRDPERSNIAGHDVLVPVG